MAAIEEDVEDKEVEVEDPMELEEEVLVPTFFEAQEAIDVVRRFGMHIGLEPKEMHFLEKYGQAIRKKNISKPKMQSNLQTFLAAKPKANKEGNEDEN